jgi:hypothetical protein
MDRDKITKRVKEIEKICLMSCILPVSTLCFITIAHGVNIAYISLGSPLQYEQGISNTTRCLETVFYILIINFYFNLNSFNNIVHQLTVMKDEGTLDDRRRGGGTNFILRIKEQETRLALPEHDDNDDDDDELTVIILMYIRLSFTDKLDDMQLMSL